jgi:hypothetical protein
VARGERVEALAVEPGDEGGDGVAAVAAGGAGRLLVAQAAGDQQDEPGANGVGRRRGLGTAHPGQGSALLVSKRTQRVFLPA